MWVDDPSMDLDDLSFLDDDDDEIMNADEQTHLQWLERSQRLSLCMKKTQETRNTLTSNFKDLAKAFTQTQTSMFAIQEKVLTAGAS